MDQLLRKPVAPNLAAHQEPTSFRDLVGQHLATPKPFERHDRLVISDDGLKNLAETSTPASRDPVDDLHLGEKGGRSSDFEIVHANDATAILVTAGQPEEQIADPLEPAARESICAFRSHPRQGRQRASEKLIRPARSAERIDQFEHRSTEIGSR